MSKKESNIKNKMADKVKIYNHFVPGCIKQCDAYFDVFVTADMLDDECKMYMEKVDKSRVINVSGNMIETPFGVTDICNISTGVKTMILVHLMATGAIEKKPINITDVDCTIMRSIMLIAEEFDIELVMI